MRPARGDTPSLAERMSDLRAGYDAAAESRHRRRRNVPAMGAGANYHIASQRDFLKIMEDARDMDRNDAIVGPLMDRAVESTVMDGFKLDPDTGDKAIDDLLYDKWVEWAGDKEACDLAGQQTFPEMEAMVLRHCFLDGDIFAIFASGGCLELLEAHRCRTPTNTTRNVVHGVELDPITRRPLRYWFTKEDVSPLATVSRVSDIRKIEAEDSDGVQQVFHIKFPKRTSQTRGVSVLAPVFTTLSMVEDINFAKLVQQQVVSCYAIIREMAANAVSAGGAQAVGSRETEVLNEFTRVIEDLGPGMQIQGRPGETLKGFSPNVPNAEFFDQIKLNLRFIGLQLGLPLIALMLDASETNFSGWRGAMDLAKRGFQRNQLRLISRFHDPVYRWKVAGWIAEDPRLARAYETLGARIFRHKWNTPAWPYIEPLKDAQAQITRVQGLLVSPRRVHNENGQEFHEVIAEMVDDHKTAILAAWTAAEAINQQAGREIVGWREVLFLTGRGLLATPPEGSQGPATPGSKDRARVNPKGSEPEPEPEEPAEDDADAAVTSTRGKRGRRAA